MNSFLRALSAGVVGVLTAGVLAACATPTTGGTGPNVDPNNPRAGWPSRFVLGIFGGDDADAAVDQRRPLQRHLQEQLGIPVEVVAGNSYSAVIEAMRARRADAMVVGPFAYILAAQEAGAEAIVVGVSSPIRAPQTAVFDPELPAHYYSVLFTRKGNGINTLNDLRGRTFAFVDPASASGHLVPKTFLLNNNLNPDRDMRTTFAGSHPTTVLAVWGGRTDAGATTENNINRLADEGQVEYCGFPDRRIGATRTAAEVRAIFDACPNGRLAPIAYSDPIPNTPFAVRRDLPDSFKRAVRDALLQIKDKPELVAQLRSWYVDAPPQLNLRSLDQYYNPLRDVARLLNLDLRELAERG